MLHIVDRLKSGIGRHLEPSTKQDLRYLARRFMCLVEYVAFGGRLRERILLKLLDQYYKSEFRRDWVYAKQPPHFFNHRIDVFHFAYGEATMGSYPMFRGFFASDILRDGDRVLDIGCGDGFFTKRFFASRSTHVDGIDSGSSAVRSAIANNSAGNIAYYLRDAVNQPFPRDSYDVVVCDGTIGHLSAAACMLALEKIEKVLRPQGVFVGSESLGKEGSDHLQVFSSLEDIGLLMKPHFKHVELRCLNYEIGFKQKTIRQEAYWRCSDSGERLQASHWREYLFSRGLAAAE